MSYSVPWMSPTLVTEYYSRMVDNFVNSIVSATNIYTMTKKASGNIDKTPKIHVEEVDHQILTILNKQIPIEQNIPLIKKIIERRTNDILKR